MKFFDVLGEKLFHDENYNEAFAWLLREKFHG